ncbi:substrate-binding domain-containing protein [Asticcacaulis sp. SL142]|uniref:substrate-binding domain-containing protein n=1 Tax=Asticcacaulis sp. SL142 TaxID=2995155 RepID=UPI00226CDBE1|nr:substrate-binding domain-containing protein [Asticcacaulis sp. SL142]WAC47682.1 substrate-binding domain-containing protein [Asticcacaulis sp. SL142]
MKKIILAAAALAAFAVAGSASAQASRDYVWAAGSSTVFPFTTRVAENYGRKSGAKAPKVESLGTGGGFKAFCAGIGAGTPDIANASRPMKKSEFDACKAKGVNDILEIKIGYDGIVIATAKTGKDYAFRDVDFYLALSKDVLRYGQYVKNPYKGWHQINPNLPKSKILMYGPPTTSGTRDSWNELALEAGAAKFPALKALKASDEKKFKEMGSAIREDGVWVDSGENDNAIIGTLTKTPGALGVFGYSFYEENMDKVKVATINGVAPTPETIATGKYPVSRSLYIYVKKAHIGVTPGLDAFINEYVSDAATGKGGYLQQRGLIPLPAAEHAAIKGGIKTLKPMARPKS